MTKSRDSHSGCCTGGLSRRGFFAASGAAALGPSLLSWARPDAPQGGADADRRIAAAGPGSKYIPVLRAAFVRRREEYGIRWPGAVYDGEAALKMYREAIVAEAARLGLKLDLRPEPIHSAEEAGAWIAGAKAAKADGLLVVLLDRQDHAWPTAYQAAESGIPSIVFAPLGTAFTVNTAPLAGKTGVFVASTDAFGQAAYGMRMIRAGAKLREMRFLVIQGNERKDVTLRPFGTKLRYIPAADFLAEYTRTPRTDEIRGMAADLQHRAAGLHGPTGEDVLNGITSYVTARTLIEREQADAITMDCLGALGKTKISLPCIAWSVMNDHGLPAACEADLGPALTHYLVQSLFDRPGFQQDPVPDTSEECLVGAHCSCPTKLNGFDAPPEPFDLTHHHGKRDAVPRPVWKVGQGMTVAQIVLPERKEGQEAGPEMVISTGTVVRNVSVPPSGGCVVSVMVRLDGVKDLLAYPGFHQLFFYGDFKKELAAYSRLYGIKPVVI
jgi:hypothetical protein